jgi:hypothetical protein
MYSAEQRICDLFNKEEAKFVAIANCENLQSRVFVEIVIKRNNKKLAVLSTSGAKYMTD